MRATGGFLWRRWGLHRSPLSFGRATVCQVAGGLPWRVPRRAVRARSWLLLCGRLRGRAEGVFLPTSPGGHLSRGGWRAETALLLAQGQGSVSRRGLLTGPVGARHPCLERLPALLLLLKL